MKDLFCDMNHTLNLVRVILIYSMAMEFKKDSFDLQDFYHRWKQARLNSFSSFMTSQPEKEAILEIQPLEDAVKKHVLREVFDKSRKLGMSLTRYLKKVLSLEQIITLFHQHTLSPCLVGKWANLEEGGQRLVRKGCGEQVTPFLCSYWREAIDGLVMGLGSDARFSRYKSLGHGDPECVDIFYRSNQAYTLGEVPLNLEHSFEKIKEYLFNGSNVRMELKGYSEGTLFYVLESVKGTLHPLKVRLIKDSIEKHGRSMKSDLRFRDITPRAIF